MVKIRYSELPAGLHVRVEYHGRDTIIYLQPGLTAEQRRAALIRVRSGARMGHGPSLTTVGMVTAVSADKLLTTIRNGAAAMRGHPLLLLPPLILLVSGAIVFVLMSFVTLTVPHHDGTSGTVPGVVIGSRHAHGQHPGTGPQSARPVGDQGAPGPSSSRPVGGLGPTASPTPKGSSAPSPTPTVSGPTSSRPVLSGSPSPSASSQPASPTPDPSPTPSQSPGTTCLQVGPLGLCLHL